MQRGDQLVFLAPVKGTDYLAFPVLIKAADLAKSQVLQSALTQKGRFLKHVTAVTAGEQHLALELANDRCAVNAERVFLTTSLLCRLLLLGCYVIFVNCMEQLRVSDSLDSWTCRLISSDASSVEFLPPCPCAHALTLLEGMTDGVRHLRSLLMPQPMPPHGLSPKLRVTFEVRDGGGERVGAE